MRLLTVPEMETKSLQLIKQSLVLHRLVNRIANRDGDAVISSCASRDGQIAMILAIRLVILSLFRAESGHKACL